MRKENILAVFVLVSSMLFLHLAINSTVSESTPTATVSIEPLGHVNHQIGDTFEINITVTNVTNLLGFSIRFYYEKIFLTYERADANGSMLKAPSEQYNFTCTGGQVTLELIPSLQTHWKPWSGSGTLVTIRFYCNNTGDDTFSFEPGGTEDWRQWMLVNSDLGPVSWTRGSPGSSYTITHIINTVHLDHPQTYKLPEDVNYIDISPVFSIESNDVVLDLNGHTVNNTNRYGRAIKVVDKNNIIIKNSGSGMITNFQYTIEMKGCEQVWISDLTILNMSETAIKVEGSNHVRIFNNNVSRSEKEALSLSNCNFSEVSHNIFSNNARAYGIDIRDSTNNTISCNQISHNNPGGIYLEDSSNNTIFNNNFINNTDPSGKPNHVKVVTTGRASVNIWNSKYPLGGNYWDDWNDTARQPRIVDEKSGENQTIPGCDGIGDTPYSITGDTRGDKYPLLNLFNTSKLRIMDTPLKVSRLSGTETNSLIVAVFGDFAEIGNFTFSSTTEGGLITFDIENGTFCNVIVSRELLDGPFRVSVDNSITASALYWDTNNTFAEFTCNARNREVEIVTKIRGDMNDDGVVNIIDLAWLAKQFGLKIQNP